MELRAELYVSPAMGVARMLDGFDFEKVETLKDWMTEQLDRHLATAQEDDEFTFTVIVTTKEEDDE